MSVQKKSLIAGKPAERKETKPVKETTSIGESGTLTAQALGRRNFLKPAFTMRVLKKRNASLMSLKKKK